ncbi:MAG TPA: phosphoribosyltransferase family protein [Pirellulaceae bacterium]|nr:phosphoribosyltransferase family protein [Pirellulaceae bacterium]
MSAGTLVISQQRQADQQQSSPSRLAGIWVACCRAADLIFPPNCALCAIPMAPDESRNAGIQRHAGIQLCNRCLSDLTTDSLKCGRCARPLPKGAVGDSENCPNCRGKRLRFDRTHAIGVYGGTLREAVLQMKQATGESLTLAMGHLLGEQVARNIINPPDHLVAVPTHWTRRLRRNVNCSEILLESIAARIGIRGCPKLLRCRRKTSKQGTLLPHERLANVRGAYRVSAGYVINGANVLLIDDVMTTGATANEIAKILRRAGAASVEVAVVARGIGFDS